MAFKNRKIEYFCESVCQFWGFQHTTDKNLSDYLKSDNNALPFSSSPGPEACLESVKHTRVFSLLHVSILPKWGGGSFGRFKVWSQNFHHTSDVNNKSWQMWMLVLSFFIACSIWAIVPKMGCLFILWVWKFSLHGGREGRMKTNEFWHIL